MLFVLKFCLTAVMTEIRFRLLGSLNSASAEQSHLLPTTAMSSYTRLYDHRNALTFLPFDSFDIHASLTTYHYMGRSKFAMTWQASVGLERTVLTGDRIQ